MGVHEESLLQDLFSDWDESHSDIRRKDLRCPRHLWLCIPRGKLHHCPHGSTETHRSYQEIIARVGLTVAIASGTKQSAEHKQLTVRVNGTTVIVKDKTVQINGVDQTTLPFKNDQLTVKFETTVFITLTGRKSSDADGLFDGTRFFARSWFPNSIRRSSHLHSFGSLVRQQHTWSVRYLRFQQSE